MIERSIGQPKKRSEGLLGEKTKTTTVRLEELNISFLTRVAKEEKSTFSDVLREAIDDFIEKKCSEYEGLGGKKAELVKQRQEVILFQPQLNEARERLRRSL